MNKVHKEGYSPYVLSFCSKEDYLPMWTNYANQAKGVCLAFVDNRIADNLNGEVEYQDGLNTESVYYGTIEKESDVLYSSIKDLYIHYLDGLYRNGNNNNLFDRKLKYLASMTAQFAPKVKSEVYKDEAEMRKSIKENDTNKVKFRNSRNGNIIPYIEVPISVSLLDYIILGPCTNFELAESALELMKTKYELQFDIRKSKCQYRIY